MIKIAAFLLVAGTAMTSCVSQEQKPNQEAPKEQTNTAPAATVTAANIDPVCNMEVSGETHTYDYEGKTYHFCAEHCKKEFMENPAKFIKAQ